MGKCKLNSKAADYCNNNKTKPFHNYLDNVLNLGFSEEPYYSKLKHMLICELVELSALPSNLILQQEVNIRHLAASEE